jgi:hypothetical protein
MRDNQHIQAIAVKGFDPVQARIGKARALRVPLYAGAAPQRNGGGCQNW